MPERDSQRPMKPVFGVENYLKGKGATNFSEVTERYFKEQLPAEDTGTHEERCETISNDFGEFVKWFGKSNKNRR